MVYSLVEIALYRTTKCSYTHAMGGEYTAPYMLLY